MRKYTSTYCNSTGHLIAIKDGTFNHRGRDHVEFHGKFYKGIRENEKCVVKVPLGQSWTKKDCQMNVNKFKELAIWAKRGCKEVNSCVAVCVPTMVQLRKVTKWFRKHVDHPVEEGELVLIEEVLEGRLHEFIDSDGNVDPKCPRELNEFIHYIYHTSGGQLAVCGLQGRVDGKSTHLSQATIHSEAGTFGASDAGLAGITRVFQNHTCTDRCKNWILPDVEKHQIPSPFTSRFDQLDLGRCLISAYNPHQNSSTQPFQQPEIHPDELPPPYQPPEHAGCPLIYVTHTNQVYRHSFNVHSSPPNHKLVPSDPQSTTEKDYGVSRDQQFRTIWVNGGLLPSAPPPYEL